MNLKRGVVLYATSGLYNVTGTYGYGQVWGSVNIRNNYFSPVANPSLTIGNNFMNDAVVVQNLLNSNGADVGPGTGFYTITPNNGIWIQNNTIDQTYRGVFMLNFSNSLFGKFVANNSIKLIQDHVLSYPQWGVNTTNNYFSVVNTNTIIGFTSSTVTPMSGVSSVYNINSTVRCNNTDNLPKGFEFVGKNSSTIWRDNLMSNQSYGMFLTQNGIIGQQGTSSAPSDNYWQGTTWSLINNNLFSNNSDPTFSKILKRTINNGYDPNFASGVPIPYGPSTLLNSNNAAPYSGCTPIAKQTGGSNPTKASLYSQIISGSVPFVVNAIETDELNKIMIYRDLDQDVIFMNDTITLSNFYNSNSTSDIGILTRIEQDFAKGDSTSAKSSLNSYSPSTNIQSNYNDFLNLYSTYLTTGTLSPTQVGELETLAYKCPHIDGFAVYNARVLFDLIFNVFAPYIDDYCFESSNSFYEGGGTYEEGRTRSPIVTKVGFTEYNIYPNPATNKISISSPMESETLKIIVKDLTNKILLEKSVELNSHFCQIDLDLINGMYFVSLVDSQNGTHVSKLVISK